MSTSHMSGELNYRYSSHVFYKKNIDLCSKSKSIHDLSIEFWKKITMYKKNLYFTQEHQKQAYNKAIKSKNYVSGNKVSLNSKYIKSK